jgi:hypothetical protein
MKGNVMAFVNEKLLHKKNQEQKNENQLEFKVSFASDSIIVELLEFTPFPGRTVLVKWGALSDSSFENQELMRWGKPYETEKIDNATRETILFNLCCELSKQAYIGYRGEYVGDKMKSEIDRVISCGGSYV